MTETTVDPSTGAELPATEQVEAPEQKSEEEVDGKEFVDWSEVDEKFGARFNRVYGHMKQNERVVDELSAYARQLTERLQNLERSDISRKTEQAVESLNRQKQEALDTGDSAAIVEIDNKIRALETSVPEPDPVPELPKTQSSGVSPDDEALLHEWASEQKDGAPVRPWADPGHPKHKRAAAISAGVMEDPDVAGKGMKAVLKEIDRLMGVEEDVKTTRVAPQVLQGDDTAPSRGKKAPSLSDAEKHMASRMYPKLSAADAQKRLIEAKKKLEA